MAYYARIDDNNIVQEVIVADQDFIDSGVLGDPAKFIETYLDSSFRKHYAGKDDTYDLARDAFIAPKPFPSYILNETTCNWESPVQVPQDGKSYIWDEAILNWVEG